MMTTLFDEETIMKAVLAEQDREKAEARAEGERLGEQRGRAEGERLGEQRGRAEGEKRGLAEGERNSRLMILKYMVEKGGFTIEEALEVTGIPEEQWETYLQLFK